MYGRVLKMDIDRFSYVPSNEAKKIEYVLGYIGKIPSPSEEPDLFRGAKVRNLAPGEIELNYAGIGESVILITTRRDNDFRRDYPEIVAKNEWFVIER